MIKYEWWISRRDHRCSEDGRPKLLYKWLCLMIIQSKISTIRESNWNDVIIQMQTRKIMLRPEMMTRQKWLHLQMIIWSKTYNQINMILWTKNSMCSWSVFTTIWRHTMGNHISVCILSIIALTALRVLVMIIREFVSTVMESTTSCSILAHQANRQDKANHTVFHCWDSTID